MLTLCPRHSYYARTMLYAHSCLLCSKLWPPNQHSLTVFWFIIIHHLPFFYFAVTLTPRTSLLRRCCTHKWPLPKPRRRVTFSQTQYPSAPSVSSQRTWPSHRLSLWMAGRRSTTSPCCSIKDKATTLPVLTSGVMLCWRNCPHHETQVYRMFFFVVFFGDGNWNAL